MSRPRQVFRVKRNGSSLQVYDASGYAGSIGLAALCRLLRSRDRKGTATVSAQVNYLKQAPVSGGCGTNGVFGSEGSDV